MTPPTQHILPDAPHRGIVINLPELRLYYFPPHGPPPTFPIGIGGEGKETPLGPTTVVAKRVRPTWYPAKSEREEDPDLPARVPPGPDNPMGDFALYLGRRGYSIHGSNKPDSVGRRNTNGCIRLYPEDIKRLYAEVPMGTPATVVNQPVNVGWSNGSLYLEVHPTQADADRIEEGKPMGTPNIDADGLILKAVGEDTSQVDWHAIRRAEAQRNGVPVLIMSPSPDEPE